MMRTAFLRAIADNPADKAAWGAYADWLREAGQDAAADSAQRSRMYVGDFERRAATSLSALTNPFHVKHRAFGRYVLFIADQTISGQGLSWDLWRTLTRLTWFHRKKFGDELKATIAEYRRTIPGLREEKKKRPPKPEPQPMRVQMIGGRLRRLPPEPARA